MPEVNLKQIERVTKFRLLGGINFGVMRRYKTSYLAERTEAVSKALIKRFGADAPEVALAIQQASADIIAGGSYSIEAIEPYMSQMLEIVNGVPEPSKELKGKEEVEPQEQDAEQSKSTSRRRRKKPSQSTEKIVVKDNIAVSDLGLDESIVEQLFDLGLGSSLEIMEYETTAGLAAKLGDDNALMVLAAIEEKAK